MTSLYEEVSVTPVDVPVRRVTITVNGERRAADIEPRLLLAHLLRQGFGLTGPHTVPIGSDEFNVCNDFNQRGPVMCQRLRNRRRHIRSIRHLLPVSTAQPCESGEGRVVETGLPDRPVTSALFLGNLAEFGIVEKDMGDIHAVLDGGGEIHRILPEAAVA